MKGKVITFTLVVILGFFNTSFSQEKKKSININKVVWFGVDFTAAKFSLVTENPAVIVNQYLKAINMLILSEPDKFDIKRFFNLTEVTNNIDLVNEFNLKIDPAALVINNDFKLNIDQVKNVIRKYELKNQSGTGLIFVAENLNKVSKSASYYVCFFDITTKEIIDFKRLIGEVSGFGFRNYWAGSIFQVMKEWAQY